MTSQAVIRVEHHWFIRLMDFLRLRPKSTSVTATPFLQNKEQPVLICFYDTDSYTDTSVTLLWSVNLSIAAAQKLQKNLTLSIDQAEAFGGTNT